MVRGYDSSGNYFKRADNYLRCRLSLTRQQTTLQGVHLNDFTIY